MSRFIEFDTLTLPEMVRQAASYYPEKVCLAARDCPGGREETFEKCYHDIIRLASGLMARGFKPGDKCAILGGNSPEWAKAYLAVSFAGGINVPLDSLLSVNERHHLLASSKVKAAFVAPKFLDNFLDTPRGFPSPETVISLARETRENELPDEVIPMEEIRKSGDAYRDGFPSVAPDDIASLIFTSGTTGSPKGVMLSHENLVSDVIGCARAMETVYEPGRESFLSVLPMHHTFECTAGFLLPVYTGCRITYARSLKSREIMEDLKACKATVMLGVPLLFQKMLEGIFRAADKKPPLQRTMFKLLLKTVMTGERMGHPNLGYPLFSELRRKAGLDNLKFFITGGAPLAPYIPRRFRRLGITMLQGYGLTEASPVLTINPYEAPIDESIGLPLPGVEVRVMEPDNEGIGDLAFRGPMIMKGYYENPEATAEVLDSEGWLRTGDLGYEDENGYIYICGRAKNLIVTPAGKNVYPEEIESELNRNRFILESMVYGKEVEGGEKVCAVIVPDYDSMAEAGIDVGNEKVVERIINAEVRQINREMGSYKRIKSFHILNEELPKTSTRKVKRHLFRPPA
jgi:long-chain acyl-CoA synthetase